MDKIIKMMLVLIIKNQNKMINRLKLKKNNKIMICVRRTLAVPINLCIFAY